MFANFTEAMLELFVTSLWETIVMVGISGVVGALLGIPLGVFLRLTDHGGVLENGPVNKLVGWVVNAVRSTPFIILLVAIIPLTRFVTGSSIGTAAAVVPLTIAAAPFVARLVEAALREVDHGLVEAAQAMGATTSQIVWKVLLPEALPGIVAGLTITFVSLTGYSAMAGAIGGGGLGDLGIRYGYQRFLPEIMLAVVLVLIFFVQAVQSLGDWAVRKLSHRKSLGASQPTAAICFSFDSCPRFPDKRWQLFLFEIDWPPLTLDHNPVQKQGGAPEHCIGSASERAVVKWAKCLRGCTNALPAWPGA